MDEPDMMIRKGGLLQSLFNRFRRRVVPSGMSRESLQQRWRTRKPLGVWCRSMFIPDKPLKIWLREKVRGVGSSTASTRSDELACWTVCGRCGAWVWSSL